MTTPVSTHQRQQRGHTLSTKGEDVVLLVDGAGEGDLSAVVLGAVSTEGKTVRTHGSRQGS